MKHHVLVEVHYANVRCMLLGALSAVPVAGAVGRYVLWRYQLGRYIDEMVTTHKLFMRNLIPSI